MHISPTVVLTAAQLLFASACSSPKPESTQSVAVRVTGTVYTIKDTTIDATFEASGTAAPLRQATLSTKLMGTVLEVLVKEGDAVAAGQPLVRIDARDLAAKEAQVSASIADAEVMQRDALTQAGRMRALYADSAATRAQLDAAETALARAEAGIRSARAAASELSAVSAYAVVRAPFAGVVTKRFVDPGAFAAPGAPMVTVQDETQLRISANATPDVARGLRRGRSINAIIEGRAVSAVVEGVVPATIGNLSTINALVANPGRSILSGSAATLLLPLGARHALVVPARAVTHQGDLTGVTVRTTGGDETRWVRVGPSAGGMVEVNAGLRAGDQVVVPPVQAPTAAPGD
jgi:RND family efflux transporter MFP subunit